MSKTAASAKIPMDLYKALSPEGKKIADSGSVSMTLPYRQWLQVLKKLEALDKLSESKKKTFRNYGIVTLIFAGVSLFLLMASVLFLGLTVIIVAAGVYFLTASSRFGKYDLDNRLRSFLFPSLAILKGDIPKDAPVKIDLNFLKITEKRFELKKENLAPAGRRLKGTDYFYKKEWLVMETTLADGTLINLKMTDILRLRKVVMRSISGKIKHKKKIKVKRNYQVAARFRKDTYAGVPSETPPRESGKYLICKVRRRVILSDDKAVPGINFFLTGISKAYGQVKPIS